jgi:hypothetical protein
MWARGCAPQVERLPLPCVGSSTGEDYPCMTTVLAITYSCLSYVSLQIAPRTLKRDKAILQVCDPVCVGYSDYPPI